MTQYSDVTLTTRGDLLTGNASGNGQRLAVGSANTVLKSDGTDPAWGTVSTAMMTAGTADTALTSNGSTNSWTKVSEATLASYAAAGLHPKRIAYGIFDATGGKTVAAHTLGATLPDNAFITGAWYWVSTTFTSAGDTATIALSIEGANDLVSAIAIDDGSNPWDGTALPVEGIPKIETTSTWIRTTASRNLTATVAVEALTAGVAHVFIEYIVTSV